MIKNRHKISPKLLFCREGGGGERTKFGRTNHNLRRKKEEQHAKTSGISLFIMDTFVFQNLNDFYFRSALSRSDLFLKKPSGDTHSLIVTVITPLVTSVINTSSPVLVRNVVHVFPSESDVDSLSSSSSTSSSLKSLPVDFGSPGFFLAEFCSLSTS